MHADEAPQVSLVAVTDGLRSMNYTAGQAQTGQLDTAFVILLFVCIVKVAHLYLPDFGSTSIDRFGLSHLEVVAVLVLAGVEHDPDHEQFGVRAVLDVHHVDVCGVLGTSNLASASFNIGLLSGCCVMKARRGRHEDRHDIPVTGTRWSCRSTPIKAGRNERWAFP